MKTKPRYPLAFVPDPFAKDSFTLPKMLCTPARESFTKRTQEILAFSLITEASLDRCEEFFREQIAVPKAETKADILYEIKSSLGHYSVTLTASGVRRRAEDAVRILRRQVFVMLYGSFETYLHQIFECAFTDLDTKEDSLDAFRILLMKKKWDGKFCSMRHVFGVDYKSSDLMRHFRDFEMRFGNQGYKDPLRFLDRLAQVRHKIVHASSILSDSELVRIGGEVFLPMFAFYILLTDYVDDLFSKKFGFPRNLC
jgi:hypothetical protein